MDASAPTANNNESPGRRGITTRPVSQKRIAKSTRYNQGPNTPAQTFKWVSR